MIRRFWLLSASLVVAAGCFVVAPQTARIALTRLFLPFSSTSWPQRTHLMLDENETTLKVARGDSFNLSVQGAPGDKIPESAKATYTFLDGDTSSEPLRTADGGEFRGRIESVNQPFKFTVTAGDDRSSIRDVPVKVVAPPTLKSLSVRLIPPEYTGMPAQMLAPGLTQVRALEGTKLELEAVASKPLAEATLLVGDAPASGARWCLTNRTRGFALSLQSRITTASGLN